MQTYRLKISELVFKELQSLVFASHPKEAAAFALAGIAKHRHGHDVIVRRAVPIPQEHFSIQHEYRLEISTSAVNGLIALCEKNQLGAVLCHSHPQDIPYSTSDDEGERRIFEVLRQFIPVNAPIASLLFYPGGVRGRIWLDYSSRPLPLSEIIVVGRSLKRIRVPEALRTQEDLMLSVFDRQVRAFGMDGQALIASTKVGVVGIGGTGSPTAEQLIRLGVQDLVLIDPDGFEKSNLTRVYGTFSSSLRRARWKFRKGTPTKKVDLVAKHLKRINPRAHIRISPRSIVLDDVVRQLFDRDIVFLCTDNHWSRSVVNQVAYQYLIPTINLGARIDAVDGKISEARGTVDILRPGMPCLWCSQLLRAELIAAESMPKSSYESLQRDGYVEGIDTRAPSVVSVTTAISGIAVSLFLQLVTDFMSSCGDIARLNYNILDSTVRRGKAAISDGCVCQKVCGFGDLKSLPTIKEDEPFRA